MLQISVLCGQKLQFPTLSFNLFLNLNGIYLRLVSLDICMPFPSALSMCSLLRMLLKNRDWRSWRNEKDGAEEALWANPMLTWKDFDHKTFPVSQKSWDGTSLVVHLLRLASRCRGPVPLLSQGLLIGPTGHKSKDLVASQRVMWRSRLSSWNQQSGINR